MSGFEANDLSVNFPTSNKSFPYSPEILEEYFGKRDRDKNRLSQYKANKERSKQIQKELESELDFGNIGKRLGGSNANGFQKPQQPVAAPEVKHLAKPQNLAGSKSKVRTEIDIPDTMKASIIADAKRNRINHQTKWSVFDQTWASRLHVTPTKVTSVRKQIYGHP